MDRDLFDSSDSTPPSRRSSATPGAVPTADVVYRSQVGACLPFTVLPRHYIGKKVAIVIVGEADE